MTYVVKQLENIAKQLRSVKLIYDVAFLEGRIRADLPLSFDDEALLQSLIKIFQGDIEPSRRKYRRIQMMLPAVIKRRGQLGHVVIKNISPGGLSITSSIKAKVNDLVLVKITNPDVIQYSFPCRVLRAVRDKDVYHLALEINGIPLAISYGGSKAEGKDRSTQHQPPISMTGTGG